MAKSKGFIKLHRSIQDNKLWDDKPFNYGAAWIDLLMMANYEDKEVMYDKKFITVKRGQRITSIKSLAERWGWGYKKTLEYLKALENEQMIKRERKRRGILVTIVKYDVFQDSSTSCDISQDISHDISYRRQTINNKKNNKEYIYTQKSKSDFIQFPQNDYDFEELEKKGNKIEKVNKTKIE